MDYLKETNYMKGFIPYALAAFLVGIVGGLSTVLGPTENSSLRLSSPKTVKKLPITA